MSRIDMIAPSTTTPATIRTRRSSLSDAGSGCWDWAWVSVLTGSSLDGPAGGPHPTFVLPLRGVADVSGQLAPDRLDQARVLRLDAGAEARHDRSVGVDEELL